MSVQMVDVSSKPKILRSVTAEGNLILKRSTIDTIRNGKIIKGDALTIAKIAGIQAVKNTSGIIPLCHQIIATHISVDFNFTKNRVRCICSVKAEYRTGVEMEALMGVSIALLTLWDMVKYIEKDSKGQYPNTRISNIHVVKKKKTKF